jgi:hypothetical protein
MPKAGSSSIQQNLFRLRTFLLERDINYLNLRKNHSGTLGSLLSDVPHRYPFNVLRGMDTVEKAARYNETIRERFAEALRDNRSGKFLISAESLCELSAGGVERLKQLLTPYAASTRIICYVRHPFDFMSSAVQQGKKAGVMMHGEPPLPKYRARIEKFIRVFGRENVDVRVLDPKELVNSDLICDFLAAIGEPPDLLAGQNLVRVNESLCHEAVLILEELNKFLPPTRNNKGHAGRTAMRKWLSQIKGSRFALGTELQKPAQLELQADLDWLHGILGREVFELNSRERSQALWGEETANSLAILLHKMAEEISRQQVSLRLSQDLLSLLNKSTPEFQQASDDTGRDDEPGSDDERFDCAEYDYELSRAFLSQKKHHKARKAAKQALKISEGNEKYRNWLHSLNAMSRLGNIQNEEPLTAKTRKAAADFSAATRRLLRRRQR